MSPKAKRRPVHDAGRHLSHPLPARPTCFEKLFFAKTSFAVSVECGQSRRHSEVFQPHRAGQPAPLPAGIDDERTAERLAVYFDTLDRPVTDKRPHAGAMEMKGSPEFLRAIQQDRVELGAGNMQGSPSATGIGTEGFRRPPPGNYNCTSRGSYRASFQHLIEDTQIPKQHFDAGMEAFAWPKPGELKSFDKKDVQPPSCRPNGRSTACWTSSDDKQVDQQQAPATPSVVAGCLAATATASSSLILSQPLRASTQAHEPTAKCVSASRTCGSLRNSLTTRRANQADLAWGNRRQLLQVQRCEMLGQDAIGLARPFALLMSVDAEGARLLIF